MGEKLSMGKERGIIRLLSFPEKRKVKLCNLNNQDAQPNI
jgi:hypothetical protein